MSTDDAQPTTDGAPVPDRSPSTDGGTAPDDPSPRVAELRTRVDELEAELARERRRRQTVIEQYERLLDERGRRRHEDDDEVWDGDIFTLLLD